MKVRATTARGIEAVSADEFDNERALKFEYFYEELPHLEHGEEMFCDLTPSQFDRLSKEYGIH